MQEDKRNFIRRALLGLGATATAAATIGSARAQDSGYRPTMEAQDAWYDQIPGKHKQVFDTITPDGVARALTFTNTYYAANKEAYGLGPEQLGVLMIFRYNSTPFAFNDTIWSKYSAILAERYVVTDPTIKAAPVVNIYNSAEKAPQLPTNALTFDTLAGWGGKFGVCIVASRKMAALIGQKTNQTPEAVLAEMSANMIGSCRFVPAGVVAVNRAQEHHFSVCYTA